MISKLIRSHIYRGTKNISFRSITVRSGREEVSKHSVGETESGVKSWKDIPGPTSLAFLPGGKFYNIDRREFANRLHQNYGPIVKLNKIFNYPTIIFLYDADAVGRIYDMAHEKATSKTSRESIYMQVITGESSLPIRLTLKSIEEYRAKYSHNKLKNLVNTQGNEWKSFRSKVQRIMLNPKSIAAAQIEQLNEATMDLIGRLKYQRNEKLMVQDFDADMRLWGLESLAIIVLGCRLNSFNSNLHENSPEKRLIALNYELLKNVEKADLNITVWRYFRPGLFKAIIKILCETDRYTQFFINIARENWNTPEQKAEEKNSILEKLLESDEITALSLAMDSLSSATDVVPNVAISTLYFLGVNPDKQALLREEISSGQTRGRYLKACLKESLRILPPTFGNARITTRSYNVLGYNISPGIPIVFMHENMSKMESNFPQPEKYIPERWLVDDNHPLYHRNYSKFASLPFGHGPRSCVGRRITELSIETLIAKMVEHFDISWEGPPPEFKSAVITYMKPPLKFVFKDIK